MLASKPAAFEERLGERIFRIRQYAHALGHWQYLPNEFEGLCRQLRNRTRQSGDVATWAGEAGDETRCYRIGCSGVPHLQSVLMDIQTLLDHKAM